MCWLFNFCKLYVCCGLNHVGWIWGSGGILKGCLHPKHFQTFFAFLHSSSVSCVHPETLDFIARNKTKSIIIIMDIQLVQWLCIFALDFAETSKRTKVSFSVYKSSKVYIIVYTHLCKIMWNKERKFPFWIFTFADVFSWIIAYRFSVTKQTT